ncbi:hypothetical protein GQ600_8383 [Phytophthora cactorum]|nr:hypothetical protein GQ600_8383 [Phytophthora cactorum]
MTHGWRCTNCRQERSSEVLISAIFGLKLQHTPEWLVDWAKDHPNETWGRNVEYRLCSDIHSYLEMKCGASLRPGKGANTYSSNHRAEEDAGASNLGPGGRGSVTVEHQAPRQTHRLIWMAAPSLELKSTTNNTAEFIGLHRLLQQAVTKRWKGIHIVGDSA